MERLAKLMDSQYKLPGVNFRFGLDALLGLAPGVGDTISAAISLYLLKEAHDLGAPDDLKMKMGGNLAVDWLIGTVPFVGDLFDMGFKANNRNMQMLREYLEQEVAGGGDVIDTRFVDES